MSKGYIGLGSKKFTGVEGNMETGVVRKKNMGLKKDIGLMKKTVVGRV